MSKALQTAVVYIIAAVILVCLLSNWFCTSPSNSGFFDLRLPIFDLVSPENQWMLAAWLGIWLISLFIVSKRKPLLESFLFLIIIVEYAINYFEESKTTESLALMAGITTCCFVKTFFADRQAKDLVFLLAVILLTIALCLALPSHSNLKMVSYHGVQRVAGIWDNPNHCGMLAAIALVLLIGLSLDLGLRITSKKKRILLLCFGVLVAVPVLYGFVFSLSRGAWFSAAMGLGFLAGFSLAPRLRADQKRMQLLLCLLIIACGMTVTGIWLSSSSELPLARRLGSIVNPYDLSITTRISSYRDALELVSTRLLGGHGWTQTLEKFEFFFLAKPTEGYAINTNSYLKLAVSAGLPCLLLFLAVTFKGLVPSNKDSDDFRILKITCRACVLTSAIGFLLDGGFVSAELWPPFWILLALSGNAPSSATPTASTGERRVAPLAFFTAQRHWIPSGCFVLLIAILALYANSQNPFLRDGFHLNVSPGKRLAGFTLMPKDGTSHPVAILVPPIDEPARQFGRESYSLAGLGYAVVVCDSDRNLLRDNFSELLRYLKQQPWARMESMLWIDFGHEESNLLGIASGETELQPKILIQFGLAGMKAINERYGNSTGDRQISSFKGEYILIGEQTDKPILPELQNAIQSAQKAGLSIQNCRGRPESGDTKEARLMETRLLGEYGLARLFAEIRPPMNSENSRHRGSGAMPFLFFGGPAVVVLTYHQLRKRDWFARELRIPWMLALGSILVAAGITFIYTSFRDFSVNASTLRIARAFLVTKAAKEDFDQLAKLEYWNGKPIEDLLMNAELANYTCFGLANWQVDKETYRDYILSPVISRDEAENPNWRKILWSYFYPKIKKETNPTSAATSVIRCLRQRVLVTQNVPGSGLKSAWENGIANEPTFNKLYVAALRSVAIPARLNDQGQIDIWENGQWHDAPQVMPLDCLK